MSLAPAEKTVPTPAPVGGVHFVAAERKAELSAELRGRRYLVAPVARAERGRLRQAVDEAVESALAMRGALPPAVHLDAALEPTIRDQVFRARALGAAGLALALPAMAGDAGVVDAADSETLLAWLTAARRAPLLLVLDELDRGARILAPVPIGDIAGPSPLSAAGDSVPPDSGEIESGEVEARTPPPPVIAMPRRGVMKKRSLRVEPPPSLEPSPLPGPAEVQKAAALMPSVTPIDAVAVEETPAEPAAARPTPVRPTEPPPPATLPTPAPPPVAAKPVVEEEIEPEPPTTPRPPRVAMKPRGVLGPRSGNAPRPRSVPPLVAALVANEAEPVTEEPAAAPTPAAPVAPAKAAAVVNAPVAPGAPTLVIPTASLPAVPPVAPVAPPPAPARRVVDAAEYRTHALELDKARGPKPVSVIERLFALRYAPLLGAIARGEADATVRGVADAWRLSFENSYRDAFSALRVTGKRPPMVFDAPEIASRIGRLNGARGTKLLLVDAMRFDVGERVAEKLKDKLTGRAVLVERMLLWSALPTTTPTNLALLGRGADGLRDAEPSSEPEPEITRGRGVSTLRRERVGAREIMKLDLVEARLRGAGPAYDERLDALADEIVPILVKFIETLPPRTLLFLFGDHGFRLPAAPDGHATGTATQGGTSPEEVLVPGQAWLVGGVH